VRALGRQVLEFGRGYRLNLLNLGDAATRIGGTRGHPLRELAVARAGEAVATQVQIAAANPSPTGNTPS
jgi:hypothetical protein